VSTFLQAIAIGLRLISSFAGREQVFIDVFTFAVSFRLVRSLLPARSVDGCISKIFSVQN
jgi:hypothetical protein